MASSDNYDKAIAVASSGFDENDHVPFQPALGNRVNLDICGCQISVSECHHGAEDLKWYWEAGYKR